LFLKNNYRRGANMHKYRTHNCGELRRDNLGEVVKISGWVKSIRDHGGVIFIDVKDHYGLIQITFDDEKLKELASKINRESTICVKGAVKLRPDETLNKNLKTGEIEIEVIEIEVLCNSKNTLPFEISNSYEAREDLRLKYRFLDLRNEKLHKNIILRSKIIKTLRKKMEDLDFLEIQTPILTSSSPEGARDYLVPSRVHPGKFYALPQAPQQFKQLLMTSGFDKYFQIAPCFRDEDSRADRSPGEFYQLDLEMAYATQEDVFEAVEKVLYETFKEFSNWEIPDFFEKISFNEAMLKYGTDKPDLRNPLIITDISEEFKNSDFKAFNGKTVRIISVDNCATLPRRTLDKIVTFATDIGAKGLAWLKVNDDMTFNGPIAKFITDDVRQAILDKTSSKPGSALFFIADSEKVAAKLAGQVRTELATRFELIETDVFKFCWIIDFPMYELNPETNNIEFSHNPFSMPQGGMESLNNKDPLSILAYQYDIICNGIELSSGAVRNYNPDLMVKAFEIAGYSREDIETKFPALFNAFQYGAPPHAGIAPGVDRIVMLLANEPNIREVIAFPMNSKAQDLLMGAPSEVFPNQLRDIHIKLDKPTTPLKG
jgi:aspartyl-tRNA synthetase